jgi:two-component system chemotaxis response regulator CheY
MAKEKLVILIVDDNLRFVERMIGLLDELDNIGHINVAADYDEARKFLEQEKPDLVLLDINLPGKSGIELLKRIKESGWSCEVIMITNHADDYYRQQCQDLGAKHFLDKSNDFGMVPEIIGRINLN